MEQNPQNKEDISTELEKLYNADQNDRNQALYQSDPDRFYDNDQARLIRAQEVYAQYKEGVISLSPKSKCDLAMLFHHSPLAEDNKKAVELYTEAMNDGYEYAKTMAATAEDRYLLTIGKKQKWGTQILENESGELQLEPMQTDEESGVTDEMRKERGVRSREESKRLIEESRQTN